LVLSILAIGFLFNAVSAIPYSVALATDNARTPITINIANVLWYPLALAIAVSQWGAIGAALAWALLNCSYVLTLVPRIHAQVLKDPSGTWIRQSMLPFSLLGVGLFGAARLIVDASGIGGAALWALILAASTAYLAIGFRLLNDSVRRGVWSVIAGGSTA
jgi:hypothetical protein